jgi:hypothetical protein
MGPGENRFESERAKLSTKPESVSSAWWIYENRVLSQQSDLLGAYSIKSDQKAQRDRLTVGDIVAVSLCKSPAEVCSLILKSAD